MKESALAVGLKLPVNLHEAGVGDGGVSGNQREITQFGGGHNCRVEDVVVEAVGASFRDNFGIERHAIETGLLQQVF
ncbi:MAG: hypothetical protein AABN34_22220 [Acidobacteriota bacterium]